MKKVALIQMYCRLFTGVSGLVCFFPRRVNPLVWSFIDKKYLRFYIDDLQESGYFWCTSAERPLGVRLSPQHYWKKSPIYKTERELRTKIVSILFKRKAKSNMTNFCGSITKSTNNSMKYKTEVCLVKKKNAKRNELKSCRNVRARLFCLLTHSHNFPVVPLRRWRLCVSLY